MIFKDTNEVLMHVFKNFKMKTEVFFCFLWGISYTLVTSHIDFVKKLDSKVVFTAHFFTIILIVLTVRLAKKVIKK